MLIFGKLLYGDDDDDDDDAIPLGLWKMFHYSAKKETLFKNVPLIYGKKPLEIIETDVTHWLMLESFSANIGLLARVARNESESDVRHY